MGMSSMPRSEGGAALVFALAVMLLVALGTQAALAVLAYEAQATAAGRNSLGAFQLAEAGLERAIFELRRDPDWSDRKGATALVRPGAGWVLLCLDPASDEACTELAERTPFPSSDPVGRYTVRIRQRRGEECGGEGCVCVRSTGEAAGTMRRVEGVLTRPERGGGIRVLAWREVLVEHDPLGCLDG